MRFDPPHRRSPDEQPARPFGFVPLPANEALPANAEGDLAVPEEWPDDLALLGEQLAADAARLAETYPAGEPQRWLPAHTTATDGEVNRPAWRPLSPVVRGAAAAVLLACGAWWFSGTGDRDGTFLDEGPQPSAFHLGDIRDPATPAPVVSILPALVVPEPTLSPASVFETLTGAEQEGLLDLLQDERREELRISI